MGRLNRVFEEFGGTILPVEEGAMQRRRLQAKFSDFEIPPSVERIDATVAIPVSKGLQQKYFFLNLATGKGVTVEFPKRGGLMHLRCE